MRLTWKKERRDWHPDLHNLRIDGEEVGTVQILRVCGTIFWYASNDKHNIPLKNTASSKHYATVEEAKADCRAYVEECLKKAKVGK